MRFFVLLFCVANILAVQAFPGFLKKYKAHPQAKPELANCALCHIAPGGGGERNAFGTAFAQEGIEITPGLIKLFPQNFKEVSHTQEPQAKPKN